MLEAQSDLFSLRMIMDHYIEDWNLISISGKTVAFDPEAELEIFDDMDELLVNWIIGAWFEARAQREQLSKKASKA
jgi:hypothetical protein